MSTDIEKILQDDKLKLLFDLSIELNNKGLELYAEPNTFRLTSKYKESIETVRKNKKKKKPNLKKLV